MRFLMQHQRHHKKYLQHILQQAWRLILVKSKITKFNIKWIYQK